MKRINKNEIRLLAIFGGVLLFAGTLLLVRGGLRSAAKDREQVALLKTQYKNYLRLQQKNSYWAAHKEWQRKNPLPVYDSSRSDSDFVERIQRSLTASGLRIEEQQLKGSDRRDVFIATVLTVKITGELENLIRWMAGIQKAGAYLSISKLTLKADPSTMVATVELSQFFSTSTP